MIKELDIDEVPADVFLEGEEIEYDEIEFDAECVLLSRENLHDEQKIESFIKSADKYNPEELEKRLSVNKTFTLEEIKNYLKSKRKWPQLKLMYIIDIDKIEESDIDKANAVPFNFDQQTIKFDGNG